MEIGSVVNLGGQILTRSPTVVGAMVIVSSFTLGWAWDIIAVEMTGAGGVLGSVPLILGVVILVGRTHGENWAMIKLAERGLNPKPG